MLAVKIWVLEEISDFDIGLIQYHFITRVITISFHNQSHSNIKTTIPPPYYIISIHAFNVWQNTFVPQGTRLEFIILKIKKRGEKWPHSSHTHNNNMATGCNWNNGWLNLMCPTCSSGARHILSDLQIGSVIYRWVTIVVYNRLMVE